MIKTPVRYEDLAIIDASGEAIAEIWTKLGEPDAIPDAKGQQIANALNTTADQSRVIEVMQKALEHYEDGEWLQCFGGTSLAKTALAEAKRIIEGE